MRKLDKNTKVLFGLAAIVGVMIGLVSQAQPLYQMFCAATGLNGTTQISNTAPPQTKNRTITVTFDGNVDSSLPWEFGPDQHSVQVKLGEVKTIKYHARNMSKHTTVGWAVHNVQPDKAGLYFNKIQCFCFTNQVLKPGQATEFPVQFYVDPELANDRNADDVTDITLSYTFYLAKNQSQANAINEMDTHQDHNGHTE